MAMLLEGAELRKLHEYNIARLENIHATGEYYASSGQQDLYCRCKKYTVV
jgi:hypothetical protein